MKTVKFYGSSDDLVEVEGTAPGCDEFNVGGAEYANFHIAGLAIRVEYAGNGCWSILVGQIDEDTPVTAKNITLVADGYTMVLDMEVPDDAYVSKVS